MQTSHEYFTTIVYAKFGGQTECIMGIGKQRTKVLKHGIDHLLSMLCFRCVQCFWILKSSLAQRSKGLFTMPLIFLSTQSIGGLRREVFNDCHKSKTKGRQSCEPMKTQSKCMQRVQSAGKRVRVNHNWFWFYF